MFKDQRGVAPIVAIIIAIFIVGGAVAVIVYVNDNQTEIEQIVDTSQSEQTAQMTSDYPALYLEAGLPQYPNATLTKKREGRNLNDGVQVTLETTDSMNTVKAFFDTEMVNMGFSPPTDIAPPNDFAYFAIYANGNKKLNMQITKIGDTSNNKIHLGYTE